MSSDAERVAELEAEVERLNDALNAADVRYQMLGEWGERMKAEVEHLRAYAEKQDELIHRLRVRAEAAESKLAAVRSVIETEKHWNESCGWDVPAIRLLAVLDGGDET